jgi:hypothetical protein
MGFKFYGFSPEAAQIAHDIQHCSEPFPVQAAAGAVHRG